VLESEVMQRLVAELRRTVATSIAGSSCVPPKLRRAILRLCRIQVGAGTRIFSGCLFRSLDVVIGERVFLNHRATFDGSERTTIGRGCSIGTGVSFITSTHEIAVTGIRRAGKRISAPIVVGDGTWIGANVTILPGVRIGRACVIGAGAVVISDCAPNTIYAGVPARPMRSLPPLDEHAPDARLIDLPALQSATNAAV
jgi:maltose O-acetyltransferase